MNSTTRRHFLQTGVALSALAPLSRLSAASRSEVPDSADGAPGRSRGLLFDRSDLARIRANLEHPRLAEVRAMLRDVNFETETRFLSTELRLTNHVTDFMRCWKLVQNSAFAYAVWGEAPQRDLCLLALRRLCDYKRWDYFLEGGSLTIGLQRAPEATIATVYALDWLGDAIPSDLRARVEQRIQDEGAPACYRTLYGLKYPDRVRGWSIDPEDDMKFRFDLSRWPLILNATNLKVIPTCGLGLAGLWFQGRHPQAERWLEMARQSAQAFAVMYGKDGSYDEGAGYWGYTTSHLAIFADALHRRLGVDDRGLINYPGTVRYALAMAMPCAGDVIKDPNMDKAYNATPKINYAPKQDVVNFGDAGSGMDVTVAGWVGRNTNDPLCHHVAQEIGGLKQLQAAVWFRPEATTRTPGPELHDVRMSNDWVVSRTGWKPEDTVVALRSGGPANHEHADRNSVILKAHGERLFHDPFKAAYSPTLPHWLLRQTEAHTAVLIDGKGHQYHDGREGTNSSFAEARVTAYATGKDWMCVTSDATDAYALVVSDVRQVERTLVVLKPDVVLLLDRVKLVTPHSVQLRFQAFNDDGRAKVTANGTRFAIQRPLAMAQGVAYSSAPLQAEAARLALPEADGVLPYAQVSASSATQHEILTVVSTAPSGTEPGNLVVTRESDGWSIRGQHLDRRYAARLRVVDGSIPQFLA
jgi:hypothetical protein